MKGFKVEKYIPSSEEIKLKQHQENEEAIASPSEEEESNSPEDSEITTNNKRAKQVLKGIFGDLEYTYS